MRRALLSIGIALTLARPLGAQVSQPQLEIVLPANGERATAPPMVRTAGVITSRQTVDLVRNGFPARLHYKLERWSAGTFVNDVKATAEWDAIVSYDELTKSYRVVRATDESAVIIGQFPDISGADGVLAEEFPAPISPPRRGEKSYYTLTLDVEAMSLSDLDEVQRWLRGELRPAVRGKKNPGAAVTTGVRTLFLRLLGGQRVQYRAQSPTFKP